jgi:rSAM/selenodomain-associated transferase 2
MAKIVSTLTPIIDFPMASDPFISVIIPVLDEEAVLAATLAPLQALRGRGVEVVVVDGGSRDATRAIAAPLADRLLEAARGRAAQMNAGARASTGEILIFLHADTVLPANAAALASDGVASSGRAWGRFDVTIAGSDPMLAVVAFLMNARSRLTGIATGDQAMFMRRGAFEQCGGFPAIPLMEDVAMSRALKRLSPPLCLREPVRTSGRRWERLGTLRTILLMWRLRLAYFMGADPVTLARRYGLEHPPA